MASVPEIVAFRDEVTERWMREADRLEWARRAWVASAPEELQQTVANLHGPFIEWLVKELNHPDKGLPQACREGFPLVGNIPSQEWVTC